MWKGSAMAGERIIAIFHAHFGIERVCLWQSSLWQSSKN